jgi:hypothetical protein
MSNESKGSDTHDVSAGLCAASGGVSGDPRRKVLVPKGELLQNLLNVRTKPVEIRFKVCTQVLLFGARFQIAQREWRSVVEGLPRGLAQCGVFQ